MKRLLNRSLVVIAAAAIFTTLSIESVFAQRTGRGGGSSSGGGRSGSVSPSRGGGGSMPSSRGGSISQSRGSSVSPSRGGGSFSQSRNSAISPSRGGMVSRGPATQARANNRISQGPNNRAAYNIGHGRSGRYVSGYNNRGNYRLGGGYRSGYGYRGGFYNRPYYSYYNYYRPFLGFRIGVLPFGYYPFYYGNSQFYYSGGLFYQQNNSQYEVVVPPVGAEVPNLPEEAKLVTINGVDYYEYKGVYYTQSEDANGKPVYVVAGKDGVLNTADGEGDAHQIGEIITQLPDGCREVTIKNEKYFVSPDDVYFEEIVDGTNITYRVIGKLF